MKRRSSALPRHALRLAPLPLAAAALAAALAAPAAAQQAAPAADSGQLDTVVITATKRIQPLQATPIAVSVLSGAGLEEANLNNLSTITQQTPTVNFRTNASNKDSALFIRGVGTISTSPGVEPTVSTVLDGIVTLRPGQATLDLLEIDRIEILRGPQGTVFGKNASAGVISIISRAPGKDFEGFIDLGFFQGNERRVRAGVSGELMANLVRGSLSVMSGKFDGNVTNVFDGSKVNGYDRSGVRGRVDITPSKDLKLTLIADRTKSDDTPPTGVPYSTNVTAFPSGAVTANPLYAAAVLPVVASPENRRINSEMKTRVSDENSGFSAQIDYTMGGIQLTSITAKRNWKNTQFQDQDRRSNVFANGGFHQTADRGVLDFSQTSQELRISSVNKQFVDYVAGLFYIEGKNDENYRRDVTRCPSSTETPLASGLIPCTTATTSVDNGVADYGVRTKSLAVFGEGVFNLSNDFRIIAGARWTKDDLSYYHGRVASATGVPGVGATRATVRGSTSEDQVSGRIGPQWNYNADTMFYATYSRGYKGPAYNVFFNMSPTQDNVLAPELSNSLELGMKAELFNRRMRLNVAAFATEYNGYQANVPDLVNGVIVTRLINAGQVNTSGVEVDLSARVTPQLTLSGGIAHIEARVKRFLCPPGAAASCDINGRPMPFSPDWKASLRAKYTVPLGSRLSMDLGGDVSWQSKVNFDLAQQPDSVQKAYAIFNASVAISDSKAGWRAALVAKNLADTSYATFIQSSGNNINRYVPRDDERYMGLTFRYDF
jgi:iron complex outermembrane recepter protein